MHTGVLFILKIHSQHVGAFYKGPVMLVPKECHGLAIYTKGKFVATVLIAVFVFLSLYDG